jgi:hypothetical protein
MLVVEVYEVASCSEGLGIYRNAFGTSVHKLQRSESDLRVPAAPARDSIGAWRLAVGNAGDISATLRARLDTQQSTKQWQGRGKHHEPLVLYRWVARLKSHEEVFVLDKPPTVN